MQGSMILTVLAAVGAFHCTNAAIAWDDLRVHFSPLGAIAGFHALPRTAAEAEAEGFTTPDEPQPADITALCPNNDPTVCPIYDNKGFIAGLQISIRRSDVDGVVPYPIEDHPSYVPTTRFGHDVYLTTLFFVPQAVLAAGGRDNLDEGTGTGLWLQDGPTREKLFNVPRLQADMALTAYTLENCVGSMGTHYYYNISEVMPCEKFAPIFALYDRENTEMLGFGFQLNGRATKFEGSRTWFESVPAAAIKPTIPNAPDCMVEWAQQYGIISLHVYFTAQPWTISCSAPKN